RRRFKPKNGRFLAFPVLYRSGAPEEIRTPDPQIRRKLLGSEQLHPLDWAIVADFAARPRPNRRPSPTASVENARCYRRLPCGVLGPPGISPAKIRMGSFETKATRRMPIMAIISRDGAGRH